MKTEIEKFGWKYILEGESFQVIPKKEDEKPKPSTLFKYYDLTDLSIDALSKNYIYAPHPDQFNDPFDCFESLIDFDDPRITYNFLKPEYTYEEIVEKIKNPDLKFLRDVTYHFKLIMYSTLGLMSMIDDPNNILMWSYYSNHRGFCLEYDYNLFPFKYQGPFQMNYQPHLETVSIRHLHLALLYQTNIKKDSWKHESEWRLLVEKDKVKQMKMPDIDALKFHQGTDRKFDYPIQALKSITLGHSFFHNNNECKVHGDELHIYLKENIEDKNFVLGFSRTEEIPLLIMTSDNETYSLIRKKIILEQLEENHFRILNKE